MVPNAPPELSLEQLIDALNEKLFTECTQLQEEIPPRTRALVTTMAAKVGAQL
jgi:hypothetical protein